MAKRTKKKLTLEQRKLDTHCKKSRYWLTKANVAWSKLIQKMYRGGCAIRGCKAGHVNSHHILSQKMYPWLKYDINNGIPLCAGHHKFSRRSAHRNSIWFSEWLRKTHPGIHRKATKRLGDQDWDKKNVDYKIEFERLTKTAEKIV